MSKLKFGLLLIVFGVVLLWSPPPVYAATKTWVGTAGGVWTTAGNWSPSGAPGTGDDVIISSAQSAPITAVPTISLNSLTVNGNCTLRGSASGNTITITTTFSVPAGVTLTLGDASRTRLNLTLATTSVSTIAGTVNLVSGNTNRVLTNNGDLTIMSTGLVTDPGGSANSNFVLGPTAILRIGSPYGILSGTTQGATWGNIQVTGSRTFNASATYVYNGTANQSTGTGLPNNLTSNLIINNPGNIVTLSASKTINGGAVNIVAGTLDLNALTLNASGSGTFTLANGATLLVGGTSNFPASYTTNTLGATSTVYYDNTGSQTISAQTYGNLVTSGSSTKTLAGATTVAGNLTIGAGTTLDVSVNNNALNVAGNWTNNGTLTQRTGTITLNGSAGQTIGGSTQTTFNNLTISNASDVTLNTNTTVTNTVALNSGDLIAGTGSNQLTLGCSASVSSAGGGDVIGDVVRTCTFGTTNTYAFNNPNTLLKFDSGTPPTSVKISLAPSKPFSTAIPRTYTISVTGGSNYSATLRLRYASTELAGMTESNLKLLRFDGTRYVLQGGIQNNGDGTNRYVSLSNVTAFSPWAISDNSAPTAVKLSTFNTRSAEFDATFPVSMLGIIGLVALGGIGVVFTRQR